MRRGAGARRGVRLDSRQPSSSGVRMRLIRLAVVLALSFALAPLAAGAQQMTKVPRIGVLVPAEPESPNEPNIAAFRRGLRDLGYTDGQNMAVEYQWPNGKAERYSCLAAEVVPRDPNLIFIGSRL